MKATNQRPAAKLSKNGKYLIVENAGQAAILNANLIRYLLDIPYTRKDGTHVSTQEIYFLKQKAQMAYDEKIKSSAI